MKHLFTKTNVALLLLALVCGLIAFALALHYNRSHFPNSFVMQDSDFGAPGSFNELLRAGAYQSDNQQPSEQNGGAHIKLVIYRNVDEATVKRTYPSFAGQADYRYLEYSEAMDFLEKKIEELKADEPLDAPDAKLKESLISEYKQTRAKIIERLGP